jgi:hypothetical protein
MPALWNRTIDNYTVSVFESSGGQSGFNRRITLSLAATDEAPQHTVSIRFPPQRPPNFVDIGTTSSTVQMSASLYDQVYRVLQTESPVFFTAFEFGLFGIFRFAGITTEEEAIGEGLRDAQALAALLANDASSVGESASPTGGSPAGGVRQ